MPRAFQAFREEPSRLDEFLATDPNAKSAVIRAAASSRDTAQVLLERVQTLLGHSAGHPLLQERFAKSIISVLMDDANTYSSLALHLGKGFAQERRLAQSVISNSGPLLKHASGNAGLEAIIASEVARLAAESVAFRNKLRAALHENPEWQKGVTGDSAVMAGLVRVQGSGHWKRYEAWLAWHRLIAKLGPWLEEEKLTAALESGHVDGLDKLSGLRKVFFDTVCADGGLPLRKGHFRLPDDHSFWPQLHEIFLNEDYAFTAASEAPRIIDAGMHMGLATYYFKSRYPEAKIIGFEPSPVLRAIAEENVRRCNFNDVTIEPYALFRRDESLEFHVDAADTMAGSLLPSHHAEDVHGEQVEVQGRRLSPYLSEPVDYLKLDIEGAEGGVLEECRGILGNVNHIFIEYHEGHSRDENSLPAILGILEDAGFDYEVSKSHGYQLLTGQSPMLHVGKPYSAIIWAKNRAWPPRGTE